MFLLHSLQSPINIGMLLRTAEVFGQSVVVLDAHDVLRREIDTIADFACGALGRRPPIVETQWEACLAHVPGRLVATSFEPNAKPLHAFTWREDDCIAFGNEYDGLPPDFTKVAQTSVWVPTPTQYLPKPKSTRPIDPSRTDGVKDDGNVSLNVAASAAIIAHAIYQATAPGTSGA